MTRTELIELMSNLLVLAFGTLILWVGIHHFTSVKLYELMLIVLGIRLILPVRSMMK
jgi:hypothetical protein